MQDFTDKYTIAIHGGSGVRRREDMSPKMERDFRLTLTESLQAGYDVLKSGGSSVQAVEVAIRVMEDSPLFNAGKGATFTSQGTNEMDAAIMEGKNLEAGGLATVTNIKNPISLARLIMQDSPYVLLAGKGAEEFAAEHGVETVDQEYFYTEDRWQSLQKRIKHNIPYGQTVSGDGFKPDAETEFEEHGTVGAVALDMHGNLAAGTSTGGRLNKRPGRIGDSPIIGSGTFADNQSCAVSTTGLGECHMRITSARLAAIYLEYEHLPIQAALDRVIKEDLVRVGGGGGAVALDRQGNIGLSYTKRGMYRGFARADGVAHVAVYEEEPAPFSQDS